MTLRSNKHSTESPKAVHSQMSGRNPFVEKGLQLDPLLALCGFERRLRPENRRNSNTQRLNEPAFQEFKRRIRIVRISDRISLESRPVTSKRIRRDWILRHELCTSAAVKAAGTPEEIGAGSRMQKKPSEKA
jgi:hypothetical protein